MIPWWWIPVAGVSAFLIGTRWRSWVDDSERRYPPLRDAERDEESDAYLHTGWPGGRTW